MAMILVLCTANICRSPVVELLLRDRLQAVGCSDWKVSSGGFLEGGYPASQGSLEVLAERHQLDLAVHRSQHLTADALASADLVLCMEKRHVEAVAQFLPQGQGKVFRLAEMAGEERDVVDPHGGPRVGYERMVDDVDDLLTRGLSRIVELARSP